MTTSGSIVKEGISHEEFWRHQNRIIRSIERTAQYIQYEIDRYAPQGPLLEIGLGTGHLLSCLRTMLPTDTVLVGIDNDPTMIEYARKKLGGINNVSLQVMDARNRLPFADETFQVIVSEHSFHHIVPSASMVREYARLLRPGGLFIFIDLAPERLLSRLFLFGYPIIRFLGIKWRIGEAAFRSLHQAFNRDELYHLFAGSGLRELQRSYRLMNQRITFVRE